MKNIRFVAARKPNFWALTPLIVFLLIYLVASVLFGDFYKVPITVAFLVSSVYAISITRGLTLNQRVNRFSRGAGNRTMMLMIWIFLLAGGFAISAKAMGAVDATVALVIKYLPSSFLLPGLFIAACFISLSIGTSVGTIVALVPVAVGIANQADLYLPMVVAIVVGGAYFGDNLSFISDTTIISTQTQGCLMSDKFKVNIRIVLPAALCVLLIYIYIGSSLNISQLEYDVDFLKVLPYLVVIVTAILGINVLIVLTIGIILTGLIGTLQGSYDLLLWLSKLGEGMINMSELIIVTLLAGGMLELIKYNGGIQYLVSKITSLIRGKRGAEFSVGLLVFFADICTANNTVAIITIGPIAAEISIRYGLDARKVASILDTFSCLAQGIIPYGAQMLMAAGLANISPTSIIPYLYYPFLMGFCVILCIIFRLPRKFS